MSNQGYAGDVSPTDAWDILAKEADSILVDCRTEPEWQFVGVPDLSALGKRCLLIDWQRHPEMNVNADFIRHIESTGIVKTATVLFLCRSGVRSIAAAQALTAAGYERAFNVLDGFEGQLDANKHRGGGGSGWKANGLSWTQ